MSSEGAEQAKETVKLLQICSDHLQNPRHIVSIGDAFAHARGGNAATPAELRDFAKQTSEACSARLRKLIDREQINAHVLAVERAGDWDAAQTSKRARDPA